MEFAVDNVQALKLRKTKIQYQQQAAAQGDINVEESDERHVPSFHTNWKDRKRKLQDHGKPAKNSELNKDESASTLPNKNAKRQKGKGNSKNADRLLPHKGNSETLSTKPTVTDSHKAINVKKENHVLKKRRDL